MKKLISYCFIVTILIAFNSCEIIDDPEEECGTYFDIYSALYYKENINRINSAFSGITGNKIEFRFYTEDGVTLQKICVKEHISAKYSVNFYPDFVDDLADITIQGHIVVGMMDYPIPITKSENTVFEGSDGSIGLSGWQPYVDSGYAYIWGKVNISFTSTGDTAVDKNKLYNALDIVKLDVRCKHPKGQ